MSALFCCMSKRLLFILAGSLAGSNDEKTPILALPAVCLADFPAPGGGFDPAIQRADHHFFISGKPTFCQPRIRQHLGPHTRPADADQPDH